MKIESPTTGTVAEVTSDNRVMTDSKSASFGQVAASEGNAFTLNSHDATAAAGTYILYLQNTDNDEDFLVDLAWVGGVASILWKVWFVTRTAAGGNALTPVNLNKSSNKEASITARGDDSITGLSTDGEISTRRTVANSGVSIDYDGQLRLGLNDAIAFEADTVTSTDVAEVFIRGHFQKR